MQKLDYEAELSRVLFAVAALEKKDTRRIFTKFPVTNMRVMTELWKRWAHKGQCPDESDWRVWIIQAGRGFGKTRAGAEWVSALARADHTLRFALVGATVDDVRKVMIEGESGLIAVAQTGEKIEWNASKGEVIFSSGAIAHVYSAESYEKLRGPEHHHAWCDELGKWNHADATWDNLMLGLRLGGRPRVLVTTTPRSIPLLRRLILQEGVVICRGATRDNRNLSPDFAATVEALYGGTRWGRQEIEGELIEDIAGALWTRELIEGCRIRPIPFASSEEGSAPSTFKYHVTSNPFVSSGDETPCSTEGPLVLAGGQVYPERLKASRSARGERNLIHSGDKRKKLPEMKRIVIGVDPPVSAHGDACGIVAVGLGIDGMAYVLADHTVHGASPEGWARAVAAAVEAWGADRVVAEDNQGGNMVESTLRAADLGMPVKRVHASRGKSARAEPVAALYEAGRAFHAGAFPELEDQMCGLVIGGGYEGPGRSPDRADALVWAMTELMLGKVKAGPRIRLL